MDVRLSREKIKYAPPTMWALLEGTTYATSKSRDERS